MRAPLPMPCAPVTPQPGRMPRPVQRPERFPWRPGEIVLGPKLTKPRKWPLAAVEPIRPPETAHGRP